VWKAYQEAVGRDVAVKVLRPYGGQRFAVQRFAREAEIHGALSHENVVAVFDSGEADCGFWLAMELVDGERLDRWLQHLLCGIGCRPLRESVPGCVMRTRRG
jgi:serine/threonine-protein kinase